MARLSVIQGRTTVYDNSKGNRFEEINIANGTFASNLKSISILDALISR